MSKKYNHRITPFLYALCGPVYFLVFLDFFKLTGRSTSVLSIEIGTIVFYDGK